MVDREKQPRGFLLAGLALAFLAPAVSGWQAAPALQERAGSTLEFTERVVAGGPDDEVTVRHLFLRGSNRDIGRKLAEVAQQNHELQPLRTDPELGRRRLEYFQEQFPSQYQRALGVGDWFGAEPGGPTDLGALSHDMPGSMGCSVVFYAGEHTTSGHATLSRNYDFSTRSWDFLLGKGEVSEPACTSDPYVIELHPDEGYASLFLCAYDLLGGCLDGVNSEGLTVALLANEGLPGTQPTGRWSVGISELEIARFLLDTCANAEEAREALSTIELYYFLLPCHYIIGDESGDSFVWEYTADLTERFVTDGEGSPLCITNHSLERFADSEEVREQLRSSSTLRRYNTLVGNTVADGSLKSPDDMKRIHRGVAATGAGGIRVRTLWHALYDCEDRSLLVDFFLGDEKTEDQGPSEPVERRSGYLKFKL